MTALGIDSVPPRSTGVDTRWHPTVAHLRALVGTFVLIAFALVGRRPDALVLAAPLAAVAAWSLLTRPSATPALDDHLGNTTIREGAATTWHGDMTGTDVDIAVAVLHDSPWIDAKPSSGVVTVLAEDGVADLRIGVRSTRWGVRPLERLHVVAATPWAAFRWNAITTPLPMTTLPLPAVFDTRADARPSAGLIGLHRSARGGEGNEFAGIRPFHVGDRMRRINWPRSIRAGELHVNSTWADLDTHIALVVDATDDFGVSEGVDGLASSLDGAVRAAGAIAEHYVLRGERVSVRAFGTLVSRSVRPASGRAQLRRILHTLALVRPADISRTNYRTPASANRPASGGQMTVMLSPLIAPEALDLAMSLGRQGMPVIVVDTLPDHVTADADPYTAMAWRIRLLERRRELRLVLAAGIPVVTWRGPGSLDHVIRDVSTRNAGPRMTPR